MIEEEDLLSDDEFVQYENKMVEKVVRENHLEAFVNIENHKKKEIIEIKQVDT